MRYEYHKLIDFLQENANPSIRLRVKKEVLGRVAAEEETDLQSQIREEELYKLISACQKEKDGLATDSTVRTKMRDRMRIRKSEQNGWRKRRSAKMIPF